MLRLKGLKVRSLIARLIVRGEARKLQSISELGTVLESHVAGVTWNPVPLLRIPEAHLRRLRTPWATHDRINPDHQPHQSAVNAAQVPGKQAREYEDVIVALHPGEIEALDLSVVPTVNPPG